MAAVLDLAWAAFLAFAKKVIMFLLVLLLVVFLVKTVLAMLGTTLVDASDNGAHAVGNLTTVGAWSWRENHRVLGLEMCFYPKVRWGKACKLDPNAQPHTASREQDDGSDDPNYCPSFGIYGTYPLQDGSGRCKLETLGPAETAPVPEGWEMKEYATATGVASAKSGDIVTTTAATLSKTAP